MKKFLSAVLVAILAVVVLGSVVMAKYNDGEYIGVVLDEKQGHTVVAVAVVDGVISNVEIINQVKVPGSYTHEGGLKAYAEFPAKVIAKQAGNIDTVAGATSSYASYNAAVNMALEIASGTYKGNVYYGLQRVYARGGAHVVVEVTLSAKKDKIEALRFITGTTVQKQLTRDTLMADKVATKYAYVQGLEAFKTFPEKVLQKQSAYVDGVAGATHSNHEFQAALLNALAQSGVSKTFEKH